MKDITNNQGLALERAPAEPESNGHHPLVATKELPIAKMVTPEERVEAVTALKNEQLDAFLLDTNEGYCQHYAKDGSRVIHQ